MSTKTIPGCTDAELAALVNAVGGSGGVDEVPRGWYTAQQVAQARGVARCTAGEQLRRGVSAGTIQRRKFRVDCGNRIVGVWHYRVRAEQ